MSKATLDGKSISLEDAYGHAARLLGGASFPLVAGLGTDVPGARAAILLAERLRGAFDHLASKDFLTDLDVMRSFSMFTTTPNETRVRSDCVVLIGSGLGKVWPGLFERLALDKPPRHGAEQHGKPRKIIWLGADASEAEAVGAPATVIPAAPEDIARVLSVWRARLGGRPVAQGPKIDADKLAQIDALVADFKAAKFGVFVWSAAGLDPLTVEMLQSLVSDLNATTRFTGLPLGARSGAPAVVQTAGWMTGYPPRTGFGRGHPEHDPWRFEAKRLVESGEADAVLWISAYDGEAPPWSRADLPLVTLAPQSAAPAHGLWIEVGRPGEETDAIDYSPEAACMVVRKAKNPAPLPSVADAVKAINARLSEDVPC